MLKKRLAEATVETPEEKYLRFVKEEPELLQREVIIFPLFVKCLYLLILLISFFLFFVAQLYFFTYFCCPVVAQIAILLPTYPFDGSQAK